jgi:septum formation protein
MSRSFSQQAQESAPPIAGATGAQVVLASTSATRARLLRAAGVGCRRQAPGLDEEAVKAALRERDAAPAEVAVELARLKARAVSEAWPRALVIGADQVLVAGDRSFDKPADRAAARAQLLALSGRAHELITATCLARRGAVVWEHRERARLVMRELSQAFIDDYLSALGDVALQSVGAYQIEGLGAQLFSRVEGDHFAILGLSLLPLLGALREHRAMAS